LRKVEVSSPPTMTTAIGCSISQPGRTPPTTMGGRARPVARDTGWSLGWKINLWARFLDGDHAYLLVRNLLRPVYDETRTTYGPGGGVYPNLFDAHPPFQIDGNFAFTSGVSEMLVQSRLPVAASRATGEIDLLPALPSAWPEGSVRGLRARGGVELIQLSWAGRQLTRVTLLSRPGGVVRVRYGTEITELTVRPGEPVTLDGRLQPLR
jgi:alpha-L-fucosidase 2